RVREPTQGVAPVEMPCSPRAEAQVQDLGRIERGCNLDGSIRVLDGSSQVLVVQLPLRPDGEGTATLERRLVVEKRQGTVECIEMGQPARELLCPQGVGRVDPGRQLRIGVIMHRVQSLAEQSTRSVELLVALA